MRKTFVKALMKMAEEDRRVLLLTADLGYSVLEPFQEKFPNQFLNVGVAEQNMVGIATGLAQSGFIPYLYSIATFTSLRPYEFIRNGPGLHQSKVRLVGVGTAFEYGQAGITHHALEDVGVLRMQPHLQIISPADDAQAEASLLQTKDQSGVIYFRLSKNDGVIPEIKGRFHFKEVQTVRSGDDVLVLTMGPLTRRAIEAGAVLEKEGLNAHIAVVSNLNPGPDQAVLELARKFSTVVTIESHYVIGGLGSYVSELVTGEGLGCRVLRLGIQQEFNKTTGSETFLNNRQGLSTKDLAKSIKETSLQSTLRSNRE